MKGQYQPYVKIYVKKKRILFPLIEEYSGQSLKNKTHGQVVEIYINLLETNEQFRTKVDSILKSYGYKNAAGLIAGIITGATKIVSGIVSTNAEKEAQETLLYQSVLEGQKKDDTTKLLVVSGIALAFVITAVLVASKHKKN
jgi:hypothetical protein